MPIIRRLLFLGSAFLMLLLVAAPAAMTGPREPLGFRDAGLYGSTEDYFLRTDTPFDFFVVQASIREGTDNTKWAEWLKKARASGKRVIADLNPQYRNPESKTGFSGISHLTKAADAATLDKLVALIDRFLAEVGAKELYAVTLGEEHVFWNGREETLNALYERLKARHDVPIYQWFSPSSKGTVPGINGWPNLKSDGWLADQYHLDQPYMERTMRGYRVLQKPVVQIIWAGGEKQSVPFIPERFWSQLEVCRKYNIPTSYFVWSGRPYGPESIWAWAEGAPVRLQRTFESVFQAAAKAKQETAGTRALADWDFVPWEIPTIKLALLSGNRDTASFRERYATDRAARFVNEAAISGFANLRWDSSPLELRPPQAGPAAATLAYAFESPFSLSRLRVAADVSVRSGGAGGITLSIVDLGGRTIRSATLAKDGTFQFQIPGGDLSGRRFKVVFYLEGKSRSAGEVLVGINSLEVEADLIAPIEKVITLTVDALGGVTHDEDLASGRIYHTAALKNIGYARDSTAGLHADVPAGTTLEVIQKYRALQPVKLTKLLVQGSADGKKRGARLGIGYSLNGVDLVAKTMSEGSFSGPLELDLTGAKVPVEGTEFYVHLFLEGGFGTIASYSLEGTVVK